MKRLREAQQQIDLARESLHRFVRQKIDRCGEHLRRLEGILRVLGPDATLKRGYSITTDADGKLIRSVTLVRPKMKIRTRVVDGEFESKV